MFVHRRVLPTTFGCCQPSRSPTTEPSRYCCHFVLSGKEAESGDRAAAGDDSQARREGSRGAGGYHCSTGVMYTQSSLSCPGKLSQLVWLLGFSCYFSRPCYGFSKHIDAVHPAGYWHAEMVVLSAAHRNKCLVWRSEPTYLHLTGANKCRRWFTCFLPISNAAAVFF